MNNTTSFESLFGRVMAGEPLGYRERKVGARIEGSFRVRPLLEAAHEAGAPVALKAAEAPNQAATQPVLAHVCGIEKFDDAIVYELRTSANSDAAVREFLVTEGHFQDSEMRGAPRQMSLVSFMVACEPVTPVD